MCSGRLSQLLIYYAAKIRKVWLWNGLAWSGFGQAPKPLEMLLALLLCAVRRQAPETEDHDAAARDPPQFKTTLNLCHHPASCSLWYILLANIQQSRLEASAAGSIVSDMAAT